MLYFALCTPAANVTINNLLESDVCGVLACCVFVCVTEVKWFCEFDFDLNCLLIVFNFAKNSMKFRNMSFGPKIACVSFCSLFKRLINVVKIALFLMTEEWKCQINTKKNRSRMDWNDWPELEFMQNIFQISNNKQIFPKKKTEKNHAIHLNTVFILSMTKRCDLFCEQCVCNVRWCLKGEKVFVCDSRHFFQSKFCWSLLIWRVHIFILYNRKVINCLFLSCLDDSVRF